MEKSPVSPGLFYTGPTHPLGAGYFLICIGYTHGARTRCYRQLIRLDKGWVIYQPNNTPASSTHYRLLHLGITEAWQIAANHGKALKFKTIEALVAEIRKGTPGINSLLLALSKPFPPPRQTRRRTWDTRGSTLQSAALSPSKNNRLSLPWPGERDILDPKR